MADQAQVAFAESHHHSTFYTNVFSKALQLGPFKARKRNSRVRNTMMSCRMGLEEMQDSNLNMSMVEGCIACMLDAGFGAFRDGEREKLYKYVFLGLRFIR
jgi:hypothetical protein